MAKATHHCLWAPVDDPIYRQYHDEEWGVPEYDDRALFEKLILDGFQAGLSWRTILYKRDNFRKAFDGFAPEKIARYTPKKVERLLGDAGIIRSKTKINAAIGNARSYLDLMEREANGFSGFLWDFVDGQPIVNKIKDYRDHAVKSAESEAMAKELKQRGFKFCGPVIVYAFMQAVGMVNDHEVKCPRWKAVQKYAR
ncbi:MAG: DNA-3-methyladenine glycosylase I [Pseudomonadota bacterium]